jgi:hypothetical protein
MAIATDKPRVFVVETPRAEMDMSAAEEFGSLEVVFKNEARGRGHEPGRRAFRPSVFDAEAFGRAFLEELERRGFDAKRDYFVLTGSTLAVSIAFAALAVQYGAFRTLVFNSAMERYAEKDYDSKNVALPVVRAAV